MRLVLLTLPLFTGCIQDRTPAMDDDPTTDALVALPDGGFVDAALDLGRPDAARDAPPLDAALVDAAPDAVVDAAPPECLLDFDSEADETWLAASELEASGRFVWWRGDGLNWIDADGVHRSVGDASFVHTVGENWLVTFDTRLRRLEVLDLTTGAIEQRDRVLAFRSHGRWATWSSSEGLFVKPPGEAPVRLGDCIRNCPAAPYLTDRAVWYLSRSRGQVEPALFRQPLDWSPHRVFEGPIRDPRVTMGQEGVHWWTITDPPMGDQGRQVLGGDSIRVPYSSDPSAGSPAWIRGANVAVFYEADANRAVIVEPDGASRVTPIGRIFMAAGRYVVGVLEGEQGAVFYDPATMMVAERTRAWQFRRVPAPGYAEQLVEMTDEASTWLYAVDDAPELRFEFPGRNPRYVFSPDGRAVIAVTAIDSREGRRIETWIADQGGRRPIDVYNPRGDAIGWIDSDRFWWVEDGALWIERADGSDARAFEGGIVGAQAIGRGADGCLRMVVRVRTGRGEVASVRIVPD